MLWNPIEGKAKKKRNINGKKTNFSEKIADHRNAILKDYANNYESYIEPKVPDNYESPFEKNKCIFCLENIAKKKSYDEFRPISQGGRMNKVNCNPCCGSCNSSKQDKCGSMLIKWIQEKNSKKRKLITEEQKKILLEWYQTYEKYMIIPNDTININYNKTYIDKISTLDEELNEMYIKFS